MAILVIAIAATGVATMFGGSAQHQASNKLRTKEAQLAQNILERVQTDRHWSAPPNCNSSTCTVQICPSATLCPVSKHPGLAQLTDTNFKDATGGPQVFNVTAIARGVGNRAGDGTTPDYFTINVTVKAVNPPQAVNATSDDSYTASGTSNPRGRIAKGTFSISVCQVSPQIDERAAMALRTNPQLACEPEAFTLAKGIACAQVASLDCTAIDAVTAKFPAWTKVNVGPYTGGGLGSVNLVDNSGHSYGPYSFNAQGVIDSRTSGTKLLPQGYYRIVSTSTAGDPLPPAGKGPRFKAPAGYEVWTSHSVPSGSFVTIAAGRHTSTIQVLQPVTTYRVYFRTEDITDPWQTVYCPGPPRHVAIKLVPIPLGRTTLAQAGPKDDWFNASGNNGCAGGGGTRFLDMVDQPTGLFAAQLIRYPGNKIYSYPNVLAFDDAAGGGFTAANDWGGSIGADNNSDPPRYLCNPNVHVPAWDPWGYNGAAGTCPFGSYNRYPGGPTPQGLGSPACATAVPGCPGGYIWLDQNAASSKPRQLLVSILYCDTVRRMAIMKYFCRAYPTYPNSCWAEKQIGPDESNRVKRYITPCTPEPATGWGSVGHGAS